jgi:hypothetical protein
MDPEILLALLTKVRRHAPDWALTGGIAIHALTKKSRPFNDLDFVAPSFDTLPATLAHDFLFRHVHPGALPGKIILQMVDPALRARIDIFSDCGHVLNRVRDVGPFGLCVSMEDLRARTVRCLLDLRDCKPVPAKYAADFVLLSSIPADDLGLNAAWADHRKPEHPASFAQAAEEVGALLRRRDLLVTPEYSTDTATQCPSCQSIGAFQPCDPSLVLALLGYC